MPHVERSLLNKPTIEPIRSYIIGRVDQISKDTLVQISAENPLYKIYFTTDGSEPDAFNRSAGSREVTHKYKAPFGLKPGPRTIRAVTYTRNGKQKSEVSTRVFDVLKTETALSEIGEEDESLSSILSSRLAPSGVSEERDAGRGRVRYMERLRRHLDDGVATTSSDSDVDFETPRSIREMLKEMETPHTARLAKERLGDSELSSSEWEQLKDLEETYRLVREEEAAGQEQELEQEEERCRQLEEREFRERMKCADECVDYAECDGGGTQITDFFYGSSNKPVSHRDQERRHSGGTLFDRSTGSGNLSDRDYGITGVTRRVSDIEINGHVRQEMPITDHLLRGTSSTTDSEYRRQVDNELASRIRASHGQRQVAGQVLNGRSDHPDCPECSTSTCCPVTCQATVCPDDTARQAYFPNTPRYEEESGIFGTAGRYPDRSRQSRSREQMVEVPGILKRGRSLERARSHERERAAEDRRHSRSRSQSPGRRSRRSGSRERSHSRSPRGGSPYRTNITQLIDIETLEKNTRWIHKRDKEEQRQEEDYERRLLEQNGDSRQRMHQQNGGHHQPSRSRQRKVLDLEDAELSLEELDARLSQFEEDSDSTVTPDHQDIRDFKKQARQMANSLKKRKDSANMRKSVNTKKKGPFAKPPSPPMSAVSLTLSSSEEEEEKEDIQEKNRVNVLKAQASKVIIPKVHTADKQSNGLQKPGGKKEAGKGALNFFNDSGTQINFWGVSPEEIAQRLREDPNMKGAADAVYSAVQPGAMGEEEEEDDDDAVDQFFITEPRQRRSVVRGMRQAQPFNDNRVDDDNGIIVDRVCSAEAQAAPIAPSQQHEQHGFLGKLGEMVKGFFGGKKAAAVDELVKVDYNEVRRKCRRARQLWEDPDFPAEDTVLYHTDVPPMHPFRWLRPHEICKNPQFIVDGASRFDVKQGVLGNCWLLAAVASLAGQEPLLSRVISPDQSFQQDYAGIFHFQFWQYGEWVDVCVDDRLPTKGGKLVYMHSVQHNEFWSPLLEKAYAKLNGCYENLSGGLTSEALTDFTGGLSESFNFREELPDSMFLILQKAFLRGSLMGCSIDAAGNTMEQELDTGLIIGHAYSITDIKEVVGKRGLVQLVRVRNPWGNHCEWNGAWSDSSNEWLALSEKNRKKLGITTSHDGEFWMSIRDFTTHFQRVEICNRDRTESSGSWASKFITSSWVKNVSAGGCRNFPETYAMNPQFQVEVRDVDEEDEEQVGTVIIALMQKSRRRLRSSGGGNLTIGYDIFQTKTRDMLDKKFFERHGPVATSPQYINTREVTGRHRLPPGNYCIVPTSFESNEEANFLMRIYSEKEARLRESDVTTSVNTKVAAKTMAVAHSAPGEKRKSQLAEQEFRARAGEDLELDASELLSILNTTFTKDFNFGSFNINSCRSMVAIRDTDATGMLGFEEFKSLWDDLVMWKKVFQKHDKDESGFFSSFELRNALKFVGYSVSNLTFKNIVMRYSNCEGHIQFNDFVDCLVRIKTLFELHERMSQDGKSSLPLDSFVQVLIYT